ncbi:MAG TPA: hypothetical protein VK050_09235, partial [Flavobacteriaceae bacterium]|nr:hypothetical protein [Flavobacteriaceae bacterium]
MKKLILPSILALVLVSCNEGSKEVSSKLDYPETKKGDVVDTYFGEEVADPYRWLEDDRSEETGKWVKAQNEVTFDYLNKIPYRKDLEERLKELWNYEKV